MNSFAFWICGLSRTHSQKTSPTSWGSLLPGVQCSMSSHYRGVLVHYFPSRVSKVETPGVLLLSPLLPFRNLTCRTSFLLSSKLSSLELAVIEVLVWVLSARTL